MSLVNIDYTYPGWLYLYRSKAITNAVIQALALLDQRPICANLAVVFDIDDTLLYSASGGPIRPVRDLYRYILTLVPKVTIFLVTARNPHYRGKTERQLRFYGFDDWDPSGLFMTGNRPNSRERHQERYIQRPCPYRVTQDVDTRGKGERKALAREQIEARGYTIWLNIGDDPTDHIGGHYVHSIKLPELC